MPLQILDGCLRGVLPLVVGANILPSVKPAPVIPEATRTWLPNLQRFLPHSWIDSSVVTSKAAKRDDAVAPTHLWDAFLHFNHAAFKSSLAQIEAHYHAPRPAPAVT